MSNSSILKKEEEEHYSHLFIKGMRILGWHGYVFKEKKVSLSSCLSDIYYLTLIYTYCFLPCTEISISHIYIFNVKQHDAGFLVIFIH